MLTIFSADWLEHFEEKCNALISTKTCSYIVLQKEKCPNTERLHLQGYFAFTNRVRFSGVKTALKDNSVHIEPRKGSHDEAYAYCTKDESRVEGPFVYGNDGTIKKSGDNKFKAMLDDVKAGRNDLELAETHSGLWLRYYKALQYYRTLTVPARDFKTEVRVYYGASGVGKSRRAAFEAGVQVYRKPRGEWWDGYDGSSNVIIDDFYGWIPFDELLRCLDRYSHRVPVKGGFVNFAPKLVIITSNVEPRGWYDAERINEYRFAALLRRLDIVEEMVEEWLPPNE